MGGCGGRVVGGWRAVYPVAGGAGKKTECGVVRSIEEGGGGVGG